MKITGKFNLTQGSKNLVAEQLIKKLTTLYAVTSKEVSINVRSVPLQNFKIIQASKSDYVIGISKKGNTKRLYAQKTDVFGTDSEFKTVTILYEGVRYNALQASVYVMHYFEINFKL